MKFEYDVNEIYDECVAFLVADGCLVLRTNTGHFDMYPSGDHEVGVIDFGDLLKSLEDQIVKKFYTGDKIIITF